MAEWYDDDDENTSETEDRNSPKGLRSQLKKVLQENSELKTKNSELQGSLRSSSIASFFRDKEINPKLAKYVPKDIEPTEENLLKWVAEDGELFNIKLTPPAEKDAATTDTATGTPGTQEVPPGTPNADVVNGWNQITGSTANALTPGKEADLLTEITSAGDMEALQKIIFSHGGGGF